MGIGANWRVMNPNGYTLNEAAVVALRKMNILEDHGTFVVGPECKGSVDRLVGALAVLPEGNVLREELRLLLAAIEGGNVVEITIW